MKSNRILLGLVVALIIMNSIMLFTILKPKHNRAPQGPNFKNHVIQQLDLNQEQTDKYLAMVEEHHNEMQSLSKAEREILGDVFELAQAEETDALNTSYAKLGELQQEKVQKTIAHFNELKSICTTEQLDDFPRIMRHAMKVLIGGDRKGPPHKPHGNHHPNTQTK